MKPLPLLAALVLLAGCAPRSSPGDSGTLIPGPPPPPPGPPPGAPAAPSRAFDESVLRGREFLLEAGPRGASPVRDTVLGPLNADAQQTAAVSAFLEKAVDGTIDPAGCERRWLAYLQAWAQRTKAEDWGPGTVRVGEPLPDRDGLVLVPVRRTGLSKSWSGWVALVQGPSGWLVSDVQMNEQPPAEPFDPEGARQLISSPSLR